MSIKLSEFDYKYFVKNHFILNVALGILGVLGFVTIKDLGSYYLIYFFLISYILYFVFCIFIFIKARNKSDVFVYAHHRYLSCYLSSFCFFLISLSIALNLGEIYFFSFIFLYVLFFIFIFFFNKKSLQYKEYWSILDREFYSEENIELYDFFFLISKYKYKNSNFSIFIAIVISQIAFVVVMNEILKIPSAYEFYIMSGIFLFISFFIIVNMKLNVIYPYCFLKQKEHFTR